ncbi:MAG: type III polyketide synthase [Chitinophagaceae bacterium]|nr:type III polyketide synthase [Chitinophagaceae bacterium]
MSKIVSIGTALPEFRHKQQDILQFMLHAYQPEAEDRRRITLLYERSGIDQRYSVIPDFTKENDGKKFFPDTSDLEPFPTLENRMELYDEKATELSIRAINDCLADQIDPKEITCLITVSCTGMSAPGLDICIMQQMGLSPDIQRSSVNFMGCYAAIHALKMADNICRADENAKVMIVCTELCTLHFQKDCEMDSIASALLFADGSAAALITGDNYAGKGLRISNFYSEVALHGRKDMAWHLSGKGFLMRLSAYIPQLLQAGITPLLQKALKAGNHDRQSITRWAIHPGGKKILETIGKELSLTKDDLESSFEVLREHGNMSSPTILFVLKNIMQQMKEEKEKIFAAAFGPGLTMETLILER